MDPVVNHFLDDERAGDYERYRPYFHPLVFARALHLTGESRFETALDVGCGTGQSTRAMASVSRTVVGLDASYAMLRVARSHGLACVQGSAERLPVSAASIDFVGIGLAFHWFDRDSVLREMRRVLKPGGWLLVFNSWFAGTMQGREDFADWQHAYLERFPAPPRHSQPVDQQMLQVAGFSEEANERFAHQHAFTRTDLVGYLKTQSNVSAAIANGAETAETSTSWLMRTLEPFFQAGSATVGYKCVLSLYRATG